MQTTREIYLDACALIGSALGHHGFKYAKSGPHAKRTHGDFSFAIHFQSSVYNSAGANVALWIHAIVRSKRLSAWRAAQPHALRTDDWVAGGQIGNLRTPHHWLDINLADAASRPATILSAVAAVEAFALPLFAAFEDVSGFCERLVTADVPGMEMPLALEFLLCFADRSAADTALSRFFQSRRDLLPDYQSLLGEFRQRGLPHFVAGSGFAQELAFATVSYALTPPKVA